MKKLLLSLSMMLFASQMIFAQDAEEKNWTHGGFVGFNVSQSHFSNWTSGGQDNVNGLGTLKYNVNFAKGKSKWDNTLDLALGYSYFDFDEKPLKTDDRINLSSLYGYDVVKDELFITANLNFQTQFADGFDYATEKDDEMTISFKYADNGFTVKGDRISGFEVAGEDKMYYEADAVINADNTITVKSEKVKEPVYARYLWTNYSEVVLFGANGIPVAPFRTSTQDK